jgi:preprotein translocase SecE subunit
MEKLTAIFSKDTFKSLTAYLGEVLVEFKRISWPGREELKESTGVVIVFIIILAAVITVCDKVIQYVMTGIHSM